jgi:hypothetical protein
MAPRRTDPVSSDREVGAVRSQTHCKSCLLSQPQRMQSWIHPSIHPSIHVEKPRARRPDPATQVVVVVYQTDRFAITLPCGAGAARAERPSLSSADRRAPHAPADAGTDPDRAARTHGGEWRRRLLSYSLVSASRHPHARFLISQALARRPGPVNFGPARAQAAGGRNVWGQRAGSSAHVTCRCRWPETLSDLLAVLLRV